MTDDANQIGAVSPQVGWSELAAARWVAAKDAFLAALTEEETPGALEGLSWAAWWLDDAQAVFGARERAFRLYQKHGDAAGAARMATWLAADELDFRGARAVAGGWLRRARRLLDSLEPVPEHGWLAFHEGYIAATQGDTARGTVLAMRAAELGRSFQVPDLEMLGLALEGTVRVACGEVEEGMGCLDEATATALAGEAIIPISRAWTCCFLVSACEAVRDYPRAYEWCDRIADFSRTYGSRYMLGFCRHHYGSIHMSRGQWEEAEAELDGAVEAYAHSRPAFVAGVRTALAELRRRQGRWGEAERLLHEARGGAALLCSARMALDRADPLAAVELAERVLRQLPGHHRLERAPALELLVRARAACGELQAAASALEELREVAALAGTLPLAAAVALADGAIAAAGGEHERARRLLEDATDRFTASGAPFEAAQARMVLASSLHALGRHDRAISELNACVETFSSLGAEAEADRARSLLERFAPPGAPDLPLPELTPREREVLRWVADGLTNGQIASRLFVSEHTIHRHVANILRKMDVPSRTAAAALAVRSGMLDSTET